MARAWPEDQLRLLGTAPDDEVAARIGRPVNAVRQKRCLVGIPPFRDRRRVNRA